MGQARAVIYTNHLEKDVEDVWWRETKEREKMREEDIQEKGL